MLFFSVILLTIHDAVQTETNKAHEPNSNKAVPRRFAPLILSSLATKLGRKPTEGLQEKQVLRVAC